MKVIDFHELLIANVANHGHYAAFTAFDVDLIANDNWLYNLMFVLLLRVWLTNGQPEKQPTYPASSFHS